MSNKAMKPRLGRGLSSLLSVSNLPVQKQIPQDLADGVRQSDVAAPPAMEAPAVIHTTTAPQPLEPAAAPPAAPGVAIPQTGQHATLAEVRLDQIIPNPYQPRRSFDQTALSELAASMKMNGVLHPIVIAPMPRESGRYVLIAGERRWRAAGLAGLQTVPAIIRTPVDDQLQAQLALVENIHRQDLNPMDRAMAYKGFMQLTTMTQAEMAGRLGEDRSTIANYLRLLSLCDAVQRMVVDGRVSMGHAKLIAAIPDILEQQRLASVVVNQGLSVRGLEQLIETPKEDKTPRPALSGSNAHLQELEKNLSRQLGLRVQVRVAAKKGRGRLVLHYGSLDQFDELLGKLGVIAD